jgi:hypothetical protein
MSLAFVLACSVGCGAGAPADTTPPDAPDEDPRGSLTIRSVRAPRPVVKVDVRATRVGAALRLDVRAVGRDTVEGAAFEDPERWTITAEQAAAPLDRLVNGSTKIERIPVGHDGWDTVVRFSLVYQVAPRGDVRVSLTPPDGVLTERVFSL